MKTTIKLLVLFVSVLFFSCQTNYWIAPPFTDVDKIIGVNNGMSLDEVNRTLGIPPYNVYFNSEDNTKILVYNYRLLDRKVPVSRNLEERTDFIRSRAAQTNGISYFQKESSRLYVFFQDQMVSSYITDSGVRNAEYLMLIDNNLSLLSQKQLNDLKVLKLGHSYLASYDFEYATIVPLDYIDDREGVVVVSDKKESRLVWQILGTSAAVVGTLLILALIL